MLTVSLLVCAVMALTRAHGDENLSANATCPKEWIQSDDRCFLVVPDKLSWAKAQRHCQDNGGNLASIHTVQEVLKIQGIMKNNSSGSQAWIAASDCQEQNTWLWYDGTPFNFTYWCPHIQGRNDPNLCCVQISSTDGQCWEYSQCNHLLPSICAKPPQ